MQQQEEQYHKRKWKLWKEAIQNWYNSDMDDQKEIEDIIKEEADEGGIQLNVGDI